MWSKMRFDNIHDGCSRVVRKKAVDCCWLVSWVDSTKQYSCIFPFITKTEFDVFSDKLLGSYKNNNSKTLFSLCMEITFQHYFLFSSFLELNVKEYTSNITDFLLSVLHLAFFVQVLGKTKAIHFHFHLNGQAQAV